MLVKKMKRGSSVELASRCTHERRCCCCCCELANSLRKAWDDACSAATKEPAYARGQLGRSGVRDELRRGHLTWEVLLSGRHVLTRCSGRGCDQRVGAQRNGAPPRRRRGRIDLCACVELSRAESVANRRCSMQVREQWRRAEQVGVVGVGVRLV